MTLRRRSLARMALGPVGGVCLAAGLACTSAPPPPPPAAPAQVAPRDPVPPHAREALAYVRKHGFPAPGFMGGRVYGNYEGVLPRYDTRRKRIEYREWDVRPRAQGRNRTPERLVTGSDGRAWYTADHFKTFVEVK